jgi:hypothetical protein
VSCSRFASSTRRRSRFSRARRTASAIRSRLLQKTRSREILRKGHFGETLPFSREHRLGLLHVLPGCPKILFRKASPFPCIPEGRVETLRFLDGGKGEVHPEKACIVPSVPELRQMLRVALFVLTDLHLQTRLRGEEFLKAPALAPERLHCLPVLQKNPGVSVLQQRLPLLEPGDPLTALPAGSLQGVRFLNKNVVPFDPPLRKGSPAPDLRQFLQGQLPLRPGTPDLLQKKNSGKPLPGVSGLPGLPRHLLPQAFLLVPKVPETPLLLRQPVKLLLHLPEGFEQLVHPAAGPFAAAEAIELPLFLGKTLHEIGKAGHAQPCSGGEEPPLHRLLPKDPRSLEIGEAHGEDALVASLVQMSQENGHVSPGVTVEKHLSVVHFEEVVAAVPGGKGEPSLADPSVDRFVEIARGPSVGNAEESVAEEMQQCRLSALVFSHEKNEISFEGIHPLLVENAEIGDEEAGEAHDQASSRSNPSRSIASEAPKISRISPEEREARMFRISRRSHPRDSGSSERRRVSRETSGQARMFSRERSTSPTK